VDADGDVDGWEDVVNEVHLLVLVDGPSVENELNI
jgi:hypothetical protein